MTIYEYADKYDISIKTVLSWLDNSFIPSAYIDENGEWFIPESAREPYTKARAKTAESIFVSIVKASNSFKHVMAKMYKISELEFEGYINQLILAGLIIKRTEDGISYYDATLMSRNYLNSNKKGSVRKFVLDAIERATKGVTEAIIEEAGK